MQRNRRSLRCRAVGVGILSILLAACQPRAHPKSPAELARECSGARALAHVQQLVDLGPRPPGSAAIAKARQYIAAQLESRGWHATEQAFTDTTPRGAVRFVNVVARFGRAKTDERNSLFLLCSHYDTKLFEQARFVGANDGGSSTGLLLELARVLATDPSLAARIELVFFDGEEAFERFSETDGLYGSRYFARDLASSGGAQRFRGGILFDMVGDRSLNVTLPTDSPAQMTHDLFASTETLNARKHFGYFTGPVTDDHSPLNAIGIPTIDIIDFDYPPWHTPSDTMDKLSAESLQIVGSVAAYYVAGFALK